MRFSAGRHTIKIKQRVAARSCSTTQRAWGSYMSCKGNRYLACPLRSQLKKPSMTGSVLKLHLSWKLLVVADTPKLEIWSFLWIPLEPPPSARKEKNAPRTTRSNSEDETPPESRDVRRRRAGAAGPRRRPGDFLSGKRNPRPGFLNAGCSELVVVVGKHLTFLLIVV